MKVIGTEFSDVFIIEPRVFIDERGYFLETYQAERYHQHGITAQFVQDNYSHSTQGVIRGLHYQLERPQGKLVCVTKGQVLDVILDIRLNSPTFGKTITIVLDDVDHRQVYIPPGYAHGFCVLSETADFVYKCTDYYHAASERGILWNDADLNIAWPTHHPVLSPKDLVYPKLKDVSPLHLPHYK